MNTKIGFWSPLAGSAGVSANTALMALLSSEQNGYDCLLMQTTANPLNNLQHSLLGNVERMDRDNLYFSDLGIDAIMRHITAGDRSKATMNDCCVRINDRLTFVPCTQKTADIYESEFVNKLSIILSVLSNLHQIVYVDIEAGVSATSIKALQLMDMVVVCLPQIPAAVASALETLENCNIYNKEKDNVYYLFSNYDMYSGYNRKSFSSSFSLAKNECGILPYCTLYKDALNKGEAANFVSKYADTDDKDNAAYELFKYGKISLERILEIAGIDGGKPETDGGDI